MTDPDPDPKGRAQYDPNPDPRSTRGSGQILNTLNKRHKLDLKEVSTLMDYLRLSRLGRKRRQKREKRKMRLFERQKRQLTMQLIRQRRPFIEEELTPAKPNETVRRQLQSSMRSSSL